MSTACLNGSLNGIYINTFMCNKSPLFANTTYFYLCFRYLPVCRMCSRRKRRRQSAYNTTLRTWHSSCTWMWVQRGTRAILCLLWWCMWHHRTIYADRVFLPPSAPVLGFSILNFKILRYSNSASITGAIYIFFGVKIGCYWMLCRCIKSARFLCKVWWLLVSMLCGVSSPRTMNRKIIERNNCWFQS